MMKIFVTGIDGQLGRDVMNELAKRGYERVESYVAPEYSGIDKQYGFGTKVISLPVWQDAVSRYLKEVQL